MAPKWTPENKADPAENATVVTSVEGQLLDLVLSCGETQLAAKDCSRGRNFTNAFCPTEGEEFKKSN